MTKHLLGGLLIAAVLDPISILRAAQIIVPAVMDNTIYADQPTSSNGAGDNFAAGKAGGASTTRRGLVAFNLTGLPESARIDRVALELRYQGTTNQEQDSRVISLHRLLANWGEGTSNAGPGGAAGSGNGVPASTNDATWRARFFNTESWTSYVPSVAGSGGGDFLQTPSASAIVGINPGSLVTWETLRDGLVATGMVADVESWLNDPPSNAGWLLKIADEAPLRTMRRFYSKEDANAEFHPRLVIDYTAVPEPASSTMGLLALSALLAVRRLYQKAWR